jgi:hypothetical protein
MDQQNSPLLPSSPFVITEIPKGYIYPFHFPAFSLFFIFSQSDNSSIGQLFLDCGESTTSAN